MQRCCSAEFRQVPAVIDAFDLEFESDLARIATEGPTVSGSNHNNLNADARNLRPVPPTDLDVLLFHGSGSPHSLSFR